MNLYLYSNDSELLVTLSLPHVIRDMKLVKEFDKLIDVIEYFEQNPSDQRVTANIGLEEDRGIYGWYLNTDAAIKSFNLFVRR